MSCSTATGSAWTAARVIVAASVLTCGCYFPNPKSVKHVEDVHRIQIGVDTREKVRELLGPPQIVESAGLYVYAWEATSGYLVVAGGYSGFGVPVGMKGTHAFVQFDDEGRVAGVEASSPKTESKLLTVACRFVGELCGRGRLGWLGPLAVAFSPDGTGLAIIHGSRKAESCIQGAANGEILAGFDFHPKICAGAAFSGNGSRFAAVGAGEPLTVWNLADEPEQRRFGPTDNEWLVRCRTSVVFSTDGSRIASDGADGGLAVWDVETGALLVEQTLDGTAAHHPSFAPDDALLAAGHGTGVVLLETQTGRRVAHRPGPAEGEWLNLPAFSPDGRHLIIASCAHVEVWSRPRVEEADWSGTPEKVLLLPFPRSVDDSCAPLLGFSADGELLAVVTGDAVTLVEVPSGVIRYAARLPVSARPVALDPRAIRLAFVLQDRFQVCDVRPPEQSPGAVSEHGSRN